MGATQGPVVIIQLLDPAFPGLIPRISKFVSMYGTGKNEEPSVLGRAGTGPIISGFGLCRAFKFEHGYGLGLLNFKFRA